VKYKVNLPADIRRLFCSEWLNDGGLLASVSCNNSDLLIQGGPKKLSRLVQFYRIVTDFKNSFIGILSILCCKRNLLQSEN